MISKLNSEEILSFLIIVSIILIASRLLGELCRRFKQPAVVGEIMAGIIIGPSLLGSAFPELFKEIFTSHPRSFGAYDGLANIGVIMLMFLAGAEVDLKQIRAQGKQAASISFMGIAFPFAFGFICIWFFHDYIFNVPSDDRLIPAMFFGTALSITALSVIVKILLDLDIIKTKVGGLVITAAMIDDFLGWILFSIIIQMMNAKGEQASYYSIGMVLVFVGFMITIGKWMVHKILGFVDKELGGPASILTAAICLCMLGAVCTEYLGIRGIFGAFMMGIACGDSKHFTHSIQNLFHHFIVSILAPLFFASVGLRVNFVTNFDLSVVLTILGIACIAKIVGAGIGSKMGGLSKNESLAIAFGMNARGSQEIVLGMAALQAGIIDERIFVGLVVMTMVTILVAGPLMKYYLEKEIKDKKIPVTDTEDIVLIAETPEIAAAQKN